MGEECCWKSATASLALIVIFLLVLSGKLYFFEGKPIETPVIEPRFGIFENKPTWIATNEGRRAGSLQNVAIILKSTSINDTIRWCSDVKKQRNSTDDLPIYTFTDNFSAYLKLKKLKNLYDNVFFFHIQGNNHSSLTNDVLKRPQIEFYIEIVDTQYMGLDFADYYFMGREAMKLDDRIDCVCGNTQMGEDWNSQIGQPDVFWLNDNEECDIAPMVRRSSMSLVQPLFKTYCIRPEVGRVGRDESQVTNMFYRVDKFDAKMMTVEEFQKRLEFDLEVAVQMQKVEWDNQKRMNEDHIYMFPLEDDDALKHYFEGGNSSNFYKSRSFESIFPMYTEGRRVYLVPMDVFESRKLDS